MPNERAMIQVKQLQKTYTTESGGVQAVKGVDFEVQKGEIFTLLGPSGSGFCAIRTP